MKRLFFTSILALIFSFPAFSQNEKPGCAKISVDGGGIVPESSAMPFSASVSGITKDLKLEYEWKVSNGTIASGQGTASITVDTTGLAGGTYVMAEVKIKGLFDGCPNTDSETGSISITHSPRTLVDEFGQIPGKEVRERIDSLFIQLSRDPNGQLYIINYGTDKEIAARKNLIKKYVDSKKYETSRLTFIKGGAANPRDKNESGIWTRAFMLPLGSLPPSPEDNPY